MLDQIMDLLRGREGRLSAAGDAELRAAVAALLVAAAYMDDRFDSAERIVIERLLAERFGLSAAETRDVAAAAETAVAQSTQLFRFTDRIVREVGIEDRARIVEMLWEVAYADGVLDSLEDSLLRRVAGLIHVPDQERGLARQRALQRLGLG
jgi:uncharacterized tellurite resistance protein B-like protein